MLTLALPDAGQQPVFQAKKNRLVALAVLVFGYCFFHAALLPAQVLTHGPVVGGVTSSSANVFLRTDQSATVGLQYTTDPSFRTFSTSVTKTTAGSSDFTAIIPLSGLASESTYYLRPTVNGRAQGVLLPPSFATFAPPGVSRTFTFICLSDFVTTSSLTQSIDTFQHAAEYDPVFAFIGGDFDHRNPGTISEKRQMFKDLYDPKTPFMSGFVPLIVQKMGLIHHWDDHDGGHNNCDRTYPSWALSQQAFQEYMPAYPLPSVSPGIWQKFSYAQVDGFVLDGRSQRDPDRDPDNANKSMLDGNNLGATGQLQWLETGLLASTAKWKIIFSSVVTNPTTKQNDGWGAFQTEWNALKSYINSNNITNVVFISGDLHLGAIDNGVASGFPEMCIAQPNSRNLDFKCPTASEGDWSEGDFQDPCSGFGVVSVQENPDRLVLQAIDEYGTTRVAYTVPDQSNATPTPTPTPTPAPPVIDRQPSDVATTKGKTAHFVVVASGAIPLTYQWRKNGEDIAGANSKTYTTGKLRLSDDQSLFSVVVSNAGGSVTSADAKLTVLPKN